MSIASGFKAMIDAITMTNSGKPIGRWVDETQASPFMSVTWLHLGTHVSLHNLFLGSQERAAGDFDALGVDPT
jgi:hypothetical protein